jgi:branched-chain amino acid transport system substrate-binding protein
MVGAMQRANSVEPGKYLAEVGKTSQEGVTAKIEFDEKGDLKSGAISVYQFKEGKLEYVETLGGSPVEAAKAEVKEAVAEVKEAAKAVGEAAKDMAKEGVKAGADAVKAGAEAAKAAVDKK